jgi:exodeoxyribonuclease VII large subunit
MNSFLEQFGDGEASSVTEYTRRIKRLLEGSFGPEWIRGEVSNLRKQASGHLYFSMKDENAQLPVVMFRGSASGLDFEIHDGMELLIYGELSVYEPHGRYQLIARGAIESGQGRLHREFERLKKKLLAEGLFDKERKRSLPEFPRHIGFITSPSGAAVQDFIRILKRRGWTGRLTVFPAKVQGRDAAQSLIRSLAIAMRLPGLEVLVVGRGGGSLEDLWCFNDESFARALAESPVPTISAVGHEIDFALSDFVADVRAETPSAAAELISSSFLEFLDRLEASREFMFQAMESGLEEARRSLGDMHARLRAVAPQRTIETAKLKLDELVSRFQLGTRQALGSFRERANIARSDFLKTRPDRNAVRCRQALTGLENRFARSVDRRLGEIRNRFQETNLRFQSLSPDTALKRGYAILADEKGSILRAVDQIKRANRVKATVQDGETWLENERERKS